jgi:hypothetical protein
MLALAILSADRPQLNVKALQHSNARKHSHEPHFVRKRMVMVFGSVIVLGSFSVLVVVPIWGR